MEHVVVCKHLLPADDTVATEDAPGSRPTRQLSIDWHVPRDKWWHELIAAASTDCPPTWLDAEDPLFMLYTRWLLAIVNVLTDYVFTSSYYIVLNELKTCVLL